MSDKVIGGTAKGTGSLCDTCTHVHKIRSKGLHEETYCRLDTPYLRIRFPIESCSEYEDKRRPSLYEMKKIAWRIESRNRGPVGFEDSVREISINPPVKKPEDDDVPGL